VINFLENSKFQQFISSYSGPKATDISSAFFILFFLSIGTFFADLDAETNAIDEWAVVSFLSLLGSLGYFTLFGYLINRYLPLISVPRFIAINGLFFSTEMFRAIFVAVVEFNLNLNDQINWAYRIVAGGFTGLIFFGLFSVNKNNSFFYRERLRELINIKNEFLKTTKVTQRDLVNTRNEATIAIKNELNLALSGILGGLKNSPANYQLVVNEIIRISDEVVRSISHEIFEKQKPENAKTIGVNNKRFGLRRLLKLATVNPFMPVVTSVLTALQIFGLAVFGVENKLASSLAFLVFITWIYVTLLLANRFVKPILFKLKIFFRVILITLVFWSIALPPFIFKFVGDSLRIPQNATFIFWLFAISTVILWPLAFFNGLQKARSEVLDEISLINEKLK